VSGDSVAREAQRRVDEAASILRSAIRLGADPERASRAMASAVREGAEELAEDTVNTYEKTSP
jgi:hypothetical protein